MSTIRGLQTDVNEPKQGFFDLFQCSNEKQSIFTLNSYPFSLIFHFIKIVGTLEQRSIYKKYTLTVRGEDERRSAKERGRGSKPRNALALGLRNVPSPYSPISEKTHFFRPFR